MKYTLRLWFCKYFFGSISSGKGNKSKSKQIGWHQISFCTAKKTSKKKTNDWWEKVFANNMPKKGLIPKIYKELIQILIGKNNPIEKWAEKQQMFLQRRHTHSEQAHEKLFNIAIYQGNENKNHSDRAPHICQYSCYQKDKTSVGEEVERREPWFTVAGLVNWYSY